MSFWRVKAFWGSVKYDALVLGEVLNGLLMGRYPWETMAVIEERENEIRKAMEKWAKELPEVDDKAQPKTVQKGGR